MNAYVSVPEFFSQVYLVDFSPSLCEVARERFAKLGWKNVKVICQDARTFSLDSQDEFGADAGAEKPRTKADFITMSYSLSMIPE